MKILVTGGCGFVGSNFIVHILKKYPDYEIVNLDKLTYAGNKINLASVENDSRYHFVLGDVCDRELVGSLVKEIDVIVHLAAESHVDRSIIDAGEFVRTNVLGAHVLLDTALKNGRKRLIQISTDEVFGHLGKTGKFSERSPYNPRSPYAASKAAADHLVRAYHVTHGLPTVIVIGSNNYGPYQFLEKLIPLFITNLIEGEKVPLYGNGENIRDWIHVEDFCEAVDAVLHKGRVGETYCAGGGNEVKNIDIAKIILKAFDRGEDMIEYVKDRKGHDFRYALDTTKIQQSLGWKSEHDFGHGLQETIDWYKKNTAWWQPLKQKVVKGITEQQ